MQKREPTFVILCPTCQKYSFYYRNPDDIQLTKVSDLRDALRHPRDRRLLHCKNPGCFAPFEAFLAGDRDAARHLLQHVSGLWLPPRHFHLRKNTVPQNFPNKYVGLFCRKDVRRWEEFRLGALIDLDLISKSLLGFGVRERVPITLFEAVAAGPSKIAWLPVEAGGTGEYDIPPLFAQPCTACRNIFENRARRALESAMRRKRQCPYVRKCVSVDCPFGLGVTTKAKRALDRCLWLLEMRQKYSPCSSSDAELIEEIARGFRTNGRNYAKSLPRPCWAGLREIGFPIVVHGHLLGIAMTGQFAGTSYKPTVAALLRAERKWRADHKSSMNSHCLLHGSERSLDRGLRNTQPWTWKPERSEATPSDAERTGKLVSISKDDLKVLSERLAKDVEHICTVANDRYAKERNLVEDAFRAEILGKLNNYYVQGLEMEGFLAHVALRMRRFWAFRRCYILGAPDWQWEQGLRLLACSPDVSHKSARSTSCVNWPLEERAASRGMLIDRSPDSRERDSSKILAAIQHLPGYVVKDGSFACLHRLSDQYFLFLFNGRDQKHLSPLPHPVPDNHVRISEDCRTHVLRTCELVAQELLLFAMRQDQEQSYNVMAHSLGSPVSYMRTAVASFQSALRDHASEVRRVSPMLFRQAQQVCRATEVGQTMVDAELKKLTTISAFAARIEDAGKGKADIRKMLNRLAPVYEVRGAGKGNRLRLLSSCRPRQLVAVSEDCLFLLITNLLDNAFKYSHRDRDVVVKLSMADVDRLRLQVRNYGITIAPDERERISWKGYRGRYARKSAGAAKAGTGFGLYLVRRLVKAVHGRFTIASRPSSRDPASGVTTASLVLPAQRS